MFIEWKYGKCDDQQCCSPRRSFLHLDDRFLSPPYPITQVNGHPTIPDPEQHDGKTFAPFLIRHCLPIQPLHAFMSMPYDLYCPSLRDDIAKRCCTTCGIYFASITKVAEHWRGAHHARVVQNATLAHCHKTSYWASVCKRQRFGVARSERSWRSRWFYWKSLGYINSNSHAWDCTRVSMDWIRINLIFIFIIKY